MKFDDVVKKIDQYISKGGIVLADKMKAGKLRKLSLGPYRKAVGRSGFALCITNECVEHKSANRAAREFVRYMGTDRAHDAYVASRNRRND